MRFIITIFVFLGVVYYVPTLEQFNIVTEFLGQFGLQARALICAGSAGLGLLLALLTFSRQKALAYRLILQGGIGLFLAGIWGGIEYLSGTYPAIFYILLIPIALMLGELIASLILGRKAMPPQEDPSNERRAIKLIIFAVMYGIVVFLLPEQDDIKRLLAPLKTWDRALVVWLHIAAIPLGLGFGWLILRYSERVNPYTEDGPNYRYWGIEIGFNACLGLLLAAGFGLFTRFTSGWIDMQGLILMPIGLAAAQAVFLIVVYRIERGPLGG